MKRAGFLAACIGVVLLVAVSWCWFEFSADASIPPHAIRIMSYNIGSIPPALQKRDVALLAAIINEQAPDVVLLQEAYNLEKAKELAKRTGFRLLHFPGDKNSHVRIMSRYPGKLLGVKRLSEHDSGGQHVICADIASPYGTLAVCSVHLKSISYQYKEFRDATRDILDKAAVVSRFASELFVDNPRSRQVRELLAWLSGVVTGPVVIGGDFNSFCLSKAIRTMTASYQDTSWRTPSYFAASHKSLGFSFPVKGDYIFASNDLQYAGTTIVVQSPGDHYPVVTNVILR